jgi:LmbE family N-acetylglucosaminyl deacetylase
MVALVLLALGLSVVLDAAAQTAQAEQPQSTVFWIFAHPDDETLAAGGALSTSQAEGHRNVVVIVSSGEHTRVRDRLSLTREEVVTSRRLEATQALKSIGVEDVRFLGIPEGKITSSQMEGLIYHLLAEIVDGEVAFRGHSPYDEYLGLACGHVDHCIIGKALLSAWQSGVVGDLRLYRIAHLFDEPPTGECSDLTPEQWLAKKDMLEAYRVEDHDGSRFAIGEHSVPVALERAGFMPECYDLPQPSDTEESARTTDACSPGSRVEDNDAASHEGVEAGQHSDQQPGSRLWPSWIIPNALGKC